MGKKEENVKRYLDKVNDFTVFFNHKDCLSKLLISQLFKAKEEAKLLSFTFIIQIRTHFCQLND